MRRVRYAVGVSLDAYIADTADDAPFLTIDPSYDFRPFFASIDTVLMGRRSYEVMGRGRSHGGYKGMRNYVFSRTLRPEDHPKVTIVSDDAAGVVAALKAEDGKDIWLSGGGLLFRSLAEADLVDTVELGITPVLIGQGIPLVPGLSKTIRLELTEHKVYPTGMITLSYAVRREAARTKRTRTRTAKPQRIK
jgi:dihydrofolate reductase